ncbi:hypothetical protein SOJ_10460 [Staphylococcus sp. OJ82]|nr:hypothetical protein SOJ_10460 [Staphylococcus sp. OJ82]
MVTLTIGDKVKVLQFLLYILTLYYFFIITTVKVLQLTVVIF